MTNEISNAMREEVKSFLQANTPGTFDEEDVLIELAMNCASRASQIIFDKLDLFNEERYSQERMKNGPN